MTVHRRLELSHLPTAVEPMPRLARHLGLDPQALLVKRDDCTGLGLGGNKARKLDYLVLAALEAGADTLVTGGGRQSNHVRMTAAAAARAGLRCVALLAGAEPERPSGNLVIDQLFGCEIHYLGPDAGMADLAQSISDVCRLEEVAGRTPYEITVGGSDPIGCQGYVEAAHELRAQVPDLVHVVCADGSGGTHAGLVVGLGDHALVLGVDTGAVDDLGERIPALTTQTAAAAGHPTPTGTLRLDRTQIGEGYGLPTGAGHEAITLAARLEGLVLDPVYTAKAMAGLIAAAREGRIAPDETTVFLHTGGSPALFSPGYAAWALAPGPDDGQMP